MSKHILVIDCGSTGIRSILLDSTGKISHRYYKEIEIMHPEPGATENDPEKLWETFKEVVNKAIHTPFIQIETIAITNQRSTFMLWEKATGKPVTNFINWQDVRAAETVNKMNRNPVWVSLRTVSFFIGRLLRNPLLTVTSMLKLNTDHSICKLRWVLDNNSDIEKNCKEGFIQFGTIDSWLLYKMTNKKVHATDFTNAAATTLLNPFMMKWNTLFCKIFKIPMNILPKVCNTNDLFGNLDKTIFGKEIPITAIVGDQQASLFGHRAFNKGDVKVTLGSGAFISMNVGKKPKFSTKGLFPLIAWKTDKETMYKLEGQVATVGTYINWAVNKLKLFKDPMELDKCAESSKSSLNTFCTPTLSGIRFPYFKPEMKSSFTGIELSTGKNEIAKSIIDGIAHRVVDVLLGMERETKIKIPNIRVDGGVSNSNILIQRIADLSGKTVYRSSENDLASIGAGFLAGLSVGLWKNKEEIKKINIPSDEFKPQISETLRKSERKAWKKHLNSL